MTILMLAKLAKSFLFFFLVQQRETQPTAIGLIAVGSLIMSKSMNFKRRSFPWVQS